MISGVVIDMRPPDRNQWATPTKTYSLKSLFAARRIHGGEAGCGIRSSTKQADSCVILTACRNSMNSRHNFREEIFDLVLIAASRNAEIVRKERAGWPYPKAVW
jgi:hypothetical protein